MEYRVRGQLRHFSGLVTRIGRIAVENDDVNMSRPGSLIER